VALTKSEALYRSFFEKHHAVMLLIDYEAKVIVDANIAATQFYGYPLEIMRGIPVSQINATPEEKVAPQRQEAILGRRRQFTFEHRLANNDIRTVESYISTMEYENQRLFFSVIHDVTERYREQEKMRDLAFYDQLTGLPNCLLFYDRLKQVVLTTKRSGHYAALAVVDVDNFKLINDMFGHLVGDQLLKLLAERMQACLREIDTVARFGGDEFVLILNDLDADKMRATTFATNIITHMLVSLANPYLLDVRGAEYPSVIQVCTVSIGVTVFNARSANEVALMQSADDAMYQAKNAGKNTFVIQAV
jgi:diguanylate cyclase (GGDEF)-like protein/PAS domain S-box-containing protein